MSMIFNILNSNSNIHKCVRLEEACRPDEQKKMSTNDIQHTEKILIMTIPERKTDKKRILMITDGIIEDISDLES